jgi:primosomal protein N'
LTESGWTNVHPEMLLTGLDLKPEQINVSKPPTQWKASVVEHRAQVLQEHSKHHTSSVTKGTTKNLKFTPNEVKFLNKEHLTNSIQNKHWQETIDQVAKDFDLNKEQEHAYHIIANHSCSESPDQLKMNIAGMAGIGKTQVLLALMHFFYLKNEGHR